MLPKGSNIFLTSSSDCCLPSIPTNSFLSSEGERGGAGEVEEGMVSVGGKGGGDKGGSG